MSARSSSDETSAERRVQEPPSDVHRDVEEADRAQWESEEKPYSVFTSFEKWFIVGVTGFGALFSPLTANIYFPAIPTLVNVFHSTTELINLTVTVYMIVQGISPMVWGTASDRWGRRPMYMSCMIVLALSCVGLALVPTNAYWLLMVLRCVQAAGSASTVALGAGVIADIAAPSERGTYFGYWSIGPMIGPCIGPVLGGILAEDLGWRSIFWFLCISSAVCFLVMLAFVPETLRAMVGDGSIPPPPLYRPLIPVIGRHRPPPDYSSRPPPRKFQNPLLLFLYPDVTLLLFYNAILYAVFYGVTASISTLFQQTYSYLNELTVGLCFLAIGGGMLIGGIVNGKILDYEYRRVENKMLRLSENEVDPEKRIPPHDITNEEHFPIEEARLRLAPYYVVIYIVCCIGYGWALDSGVNIAVPLILQFIIGWVVVSVMNIAQTLIIDLVPRSSSSVTACNNLVRCSFGAVLVSIINIILDALGTGWTYVLLAGICVALSPCMFFSRYWGPKWRAQRRARRNAEKERARVAEEKAQEKDAALNPGEHPADTALNVQHDSD